VLANDSQGGPDDTARKQRAIDAITVEGTAVDDVPVPSTQLVRRERRSEVLRPLDRGQLVASFRDYQELCRELLDDSDYQDYTQRERDPSGVWQTVQKRFKKKSAWRKLATAFDLDVALVGEVKVSRDQEGQPLRAAAIARAIAPSGRYMEGSGYCSVEEPRFAKEKGREKLEERPPRHRRDTRQEPRDQRPARHQRGLSRRAERRPGRTVHDRRLRRRDGRRDGQGGRRRGHAAGRR
jgi:hypothetical protein